MPQQSTSCGGIFIVLGFNEVILPAIWETETFLNKLGSEKEGQMWTFRDKGDRNCCLIPEATGIIQEMWRNDWSKSQPRPMKIFYVTRCYRYERPQAGRYREFTQVGVEILGGQPPDDIDLAKRSLSQIMGQFKLNWRFVDSVKRGLAYYVEDGFEVECKDLGAQKQIAGGGRYAEGVGWAIGLERLLLAQQPPG